MKKRIIRTYTKSKSTTHTFSRVRIILFICCIFGLFGVVLFRSFMLQIVNYHKYVTLAQSQHTREYQLYGERGEIFFQDMKTGNLFPMAINRKLYDIALDPKMLASQSKDHNTSLANSLSELIPAVTTQEVWSILAKTDDQWELVARDVALDTVERIKQKGFKGIVYEEKKERFYPEVTLGAHVLGYVRKDNASLGQYGLEQFYNDVLKGQNGFERKTSDTRGTWLATTDRERTDPVEGADLILTIDHTIQYKLEETLSQLFQQFKPKAVMGIIMDPKTGDVLAMASQPSFDPNNYNNVQNLGVFTNPLVSNLYEPGSVFKPFTVGIGLDGGVIAPETEYTDTGSITLNGFTIRNALQKSYGVQSMRFALNNSLNTGMVFIEQKLGRERFTQGLWDQFQLDKPTGIDLPGEATGNFSNLQKNIHDARDINFATASYGQGIAVTPLRILTSFNSIPNQGIMMQPRLVKKIRYKDGSVEEIPAKEVGRTISAEAAAQLSDMLVSVVDEGHGQKADVPGYSIGGKTGTAQIAVPGGYGDDTFQSFIQFATLADTRYTLLISMDSPQGARFSDASVVPATKGLNEFLLNYFQIQADNLDQNETQ